MTLTKRIFSPTPWTVQKSRASFDLYIVNASEQASATKLVALIKSGTGIMYSEFAEDDAYLIANSPKMMRELKKARDSLATMERKSPDEKIARQVARLTKFLGELENKEVPKTR